MRSLSSQCASVLLVLSLVRVARALVGLRGSCLVMLVLPLKHLVLAGNLEFVGCRCVLFESGNRSAVNPFLFPLPVALTDFADLLVVTGHGEEEEVRCEQTGKTKRLEIVWSVSFWPQRKTPATAVGSQRQRSQEVERLSTGVEKQCTSVKVMYVALCK